MVTVKNFGETMSDLKKSIPLIFTFLLKTSLSLLFLLDFFPVFMGSTSQRYAQAQASFKNMNCQQISGAIVRYCTQNSVLQQTEAKNTLMQQLLAAYGGDQGAAQQAFAAQTSGQETQVAVQEAKAICTDANNHCKQRCDNERGWLQTGCRGQPACLQSVHPQIEQLQSMKKQCNQEFQAAQGKFNDSLGEIAKLLGGVASLLAALGHNKNDNVDGLPNLDDEDDVCEGPDADKILKCRGRPDPTNGGRPLVTGSGGSKHGLSGSNPFQVAQKSGEPGGEKRDGHDNSSGAFNGNNGGSLGAFGAMGEGGLAATNGEPENQGSEEEGSSSYGYMGAGGAGSSGGGGGLGRRFGNFGNFSPSSSGAKMASQSDIDKQLKKYSKANSRAPASAGGGLNGPFQDNWEVVRKAYQKNSDTLLKR